MPSALAAAPERTFLVNQHLRNLCTCALGPPDQGHTGAAGMTRRVVARHFGLAAALVQAKGWMQSCCSKFIAIYSGATPAISAWLGGGFDALKGLKNGLWRLFEAFSGRQNSS